MSLDELALYAQLHFRCAKYGHVKSWKWYLPVLFMSKRRVEQAHQMFKAVFTSVAWWLYRQFWCPVENVESLLSIHLDVLNYLQINYLLWRCCKLARAGCRGALTSCYSFSLLQSLPLVRCLTTKKRSLFKQKTSNYTPAVYFHKIFHSLTHKHLTESLVTCVSREYKGCWVWTAFESNWIEGSSKTKRWE